MMYAVVTFVMSLLVFLAIVIWGLPWLRSRELCREAEVMARLGESLIIPQAQMANDLSPMLDKYIGPNTVLRIPGGDPSALFRLLYPWKRDLKRWLKRGAKISYYLVEPSKRARKAVEELEKNPNFELFIIPSVDDIEGEEDRKLIESLRTYHTTLLENQSAKGKDGPQRAMWLEAYHPANSWFAFGCEFVQPPAANHDERFAEFSEVLNRVTEIHNKIAQKSPSG